MTTSHWFYLEFLVKAFLLWNVTHQRCWFHWSQQTALAVILSIGMPKTKASVQHLWFISELKQQRNMPMERNESIGISSTPKLQQSLAHCHWALAHMQIWTPALGITQPTRITQAAPGQQFLGSPELCSCLILATLPTSTISAFLNSCFAETFLFSSHLMVKESW